MSFLFNNVAAIVVALVASVTVWLFAGTRPNVLLPVVPWLFALMIETLLCFPQRHRGETTYEARDRVWRTLKGDPVLWIATGLLVLLLIPLANNGLCPFCDAAKIAAGLDPLPAVPFLPSCVSRRSHLEVLSWFALALPALVIVRDGLTRRGKRLVLELIVWNGLAVAILGFVQLATGATGPFWKELREPYWNQLVFFFSTFGYPNMAGDYFTVLFGVTVALWRDHSVQMAEEKKREIKSDEHVSRPRMFWKRHYFLIPAAVFFFAALNTLSRAAILLVSLTAVVCFAHTLVSGLAHRSKAKRVTIGVWSMLAFGVVVFFASLFMPEKIKKETGTIDVVSTLDRVSGRGQYHERVATALWRDHKLFGIGGWGYAHLCMTKMNEKEIKGRQMMGGANVHNDYLQFLAEHGLVGFGAMVAIVVLLLMPVFRDWKRLVREARFKKGKDRPPRPIQIFSLPAPVFIILAATVTTLIHAFGDCPLRSPAILILFVVDLAALPGFMPRLKPEERHSHHH